MEIGNTTYVQQWLGTFLLLLWKDWGLELHTDIVDASTEGVVVLSKFNALLVFSEAPTIRNDCALVSTAFSRINSRHLVLPW